MLKITKVTIGSGAIPDGMAPEKMTDLAQHRIAGKITAIENPDNGEALISTQILSAGLSEGFFASEIVIWAYDPDDGEIAYNYVSLQQFPEWLRPDGDAVHKIVTINVIAIVSSVPLDKASIDPDAFARAKDLMALNPNTLLCSLSIKSNDYFAVWSLYRNVGGITAPLEAWGFTNATLAELPSKVVVDINNSRVMIYSTSDYADREWAAEPYQEGVWILTAADKSLVLVRR